MQRLRKQSVGEAVATGAVASVAHAFVVSALWYWFGFENLVASLPEADAVYSILGVVAVGFVPGFCYARYETASPLALVAGLLALAGFGSWRIGSSGLTPVDPTPLGWYVLLWVAVAAAAAVLAGLEARLVRSPDGA